MTANTFLRAHGAPPPVREPGDDDEAPRMITLGDIARMRKLRIGPPVNDERARIYRELGARLRSRVADDMDLDRAATSKRHTLATIEGAGKVVSTLLEQARKRGDAVAVAAYAPHVSWLRAQYQEARGDAAAVVEAKPAPVVVTPPSAPRATPKPVVVVDAEVAAVLDDYLDPMA